MESTEFDRRKFLGRAVGAGAALTLGGLAAPGRQPPTLRVENVSASRSSVVAVFRTDICQSWPRVRGRSW